MTKKISDAPQNLAQLEKWRSEKGAWICDDYYLRQVDRKWRSLGRQVNSAPAQLRNAERHN